MTENFVNYIPLKIYRFLRWEISQRKKYLYNRRNFSKEYADICYKAEWMIRKKVSTNSILVELEKKDNYIIDYLERLCADVIGRYKIKSNLSSKVNTSNIIWVYWWDGEEAAPDIVKACIKSIRRNSNGHEVVMMNKNNYKEYVTLPKTIVDKHKKGIIGHAHYSDIVRLSLLEKYGGIWIDATVFLTQPIPEEIFNKEFYTLKTFNEKLLFFSKSRWCGYFLAGDKDFPIFSFVKDCLVTHWERTDVIIDYLIMDYFFELAYRNIDKVKNTIDSLEDNNIKRGMLMEKINEPYSKELFYSLETQETFASKLSWRYGNPRKFTADGQLTNYGYIQSL